MPTTDQDQLTSILNGIGPGVVAVDREGRVTWLNCTAAGILSVDATCVGSALDLRGAKGKAATLLTEALTGQAGVGELRLRVHGNQRIIEVKTNPLRDQDRTITGAVAVFDDVTELRRLERIRQDFIANVSHELKTPVTAIQGLTETLLDDTAMPAATQQRFLERVRAQTDRLSHLVHDLLTISRLEVGEELTELTPLDLRQTLQESLRVLRPSGEARSLTLRESISQTPLVINADPEALRQIADNLIDNALKYTPPHGRVTIALRAEDRFAVLEVADTGVGIAREHIERIFERFYRVDKARSRAIGGTGLGLSIVKHRVQSLGGQVSVESRPGVGTTFRVRLPLVETDVRRESGENLH